MSSLQTLPSSEASVPPLLLDQPLTIDNVIYTSRQIHDISQKVETSIPQRTEHFFRLQNRMTLSDEPNHEADAARVHHFATNAFVNGAILQRKIDAEFLKVITGHIARVLLELLMYRFKYGKEYEHIEEVRVVVSLIIWYKRLHINENAKRDESYGIWPNVEDDLYETACKMSARHYCDSTDARASALLFSQLLTERKITTNSISLGNATFYAYVTSGNSIQILWYCVSGITIPNLKNNKGEEYVINEGELETTQVLDILTSSGEMAIRTFNGETFTNTELNGVVAWTLSDPLSLFIDVNTRIAYVFLTYCYLISSLVLALLTAILNWGARESAFQRFLDGALLFLLLLITAFILIKMVFRDSFNVSSLLRGKRRLFDIQSLAQHSNIPLKQVLLRLANAEKVLFLTEANSSYVSGPKNGNVDLPLMMNERDLSRTFIIGAVCALDNKGGWRRVEDREGILRIGDHIPDGISLIALREDSSRYVGGNCD